MKNKFLVFYLLAILPFLGMSQVFGDGPKNDPVEWSGEIEKLDNTSFRLSYSANVEKDWHIYSIETQAGLPLHLQFENLENNYELNGKAEESGTETKYDSIFEDFTTIYTGYSPLIKQSITLKNEDLRVVKTTVSYQVCKEVCIPQTFYLAHDLIKDKVVVFRDDEVSAFESYGHNVKEVSKDENAPVKKNKKNDSDKSLLTVFILSFLGGFAALLTPCVFPMIPMTVSFFTKQSSNRVAGIRKAIFYGISIIAIYVILGLAVTAIFGETAIIELSTSVWFNILFFLMLVIFAVSFFGAFEIMLPNSWANKVDKQADRGGLIGIFFMALALAIVSFSCTGPIVGTALVQSALEGGITPVISMLGFSSAIALPFTLFAIFPGWMKALPKSGGWLNTVKVVLGFLELALAFKFLSNADLVIDGHYLEREVFLAIIIAIMIGLALYLFGKIRLPHDGEANHISVGRLCLGLLTTAFVVYLIPGLWGAPLKLISGFPPPMNYSESPYGIGSSSSNIVDSENEFPDKAELGPHGLLSFTDYKAGMDYAKKVNKTVLLDFTGKACINCRRMEELVWSDPSVLNILKNDIVLISLYGDSRKLLPESEQGISNSGRRIKTVGNKWLDFQIERFGIVAAPYYVLLDHDETTLNEPVAYTPDIATYKNWLQEGINQFNNN